MTDKHIVELLDSISLVELTSDQLGMVRVHTDSCGSCKQAFEAALLTSVAIRQRAGVAVEPSPFFQTRVLAALREQQASNSVPALLRIWQNAGKFVKSMALTTAALAALSFFVAPTSNTADQTLAAQSAEALIFDQGSDDLTYEQVLTAIYAEEDEAK
jgi:hypothetical protein